jgi:arylformamidase
MKIIDISVEISPQMQVYKNRDEKKPQFNAAAVIEESGVNETLLSVNLHTGTHIDAPSHILTNGESTSVYPLEKFFVPAFVVDVSTCGKKISAKDLKVHNIPENHFVLLRTENSVLRNFSTDFASLAEDGATYLKSLGSIGVGIDAAGIEFAAKGHPAHHVLLENGVIILEGLDLFSVEQGAYVLSAFPLNLADSDAAPVRAVLIDDKNLYLTFF